jgi:hypothetical protein
MEANKDFLTKLQKRFRSHIFKDGKEFGIEMQNEIWYIGYNDKKFKRISDFLVNNDYSYVFYDAETCCIFSTK